MVGGGKISTKTNANERVRSKDRCSDDSDEDYVISDEENELSEASGEDYCTSLEAETSNEVFNSFKDVEEQVDLGKIRQFVKPKAKEDNCGRRTAKKTSKTKRVSSYEEDDDYNEEEESNDEDEEDDYEEEKEEDDDEEEFTLEEEEEEEEESFDEESVVVRKKKRNTNTWKPGLQRKGINTKRRRKSNASKTRSRMRMKTSSRLGRNIKRQSNDDVMDKTRVLSVKINKVPGQRKRRKIVKSDSDFAPSGSSDYEYTISEEEREQVREAEELCGNLRSSSVPDKTLEEKTKHGQTKPLGRKGKEKVEEVKVEVGKQLCGICLSEEDKRRVRGTLECCTHYFCFTCIMEWAKVESRCPLCKQRFKTISKPARSAAGVDLREVVVQIPERDQVYQPSEEELRSYLDPYEHVLCTECHLGGDDGLMLLCDLCDSPAHTYCVGLGGQVPEGNWYCDGCRPVAMGSGSQGSGRFSNWRTTANNLNNGPSPAVNVCERLDLNSIASPRTAFAQGFGSLPSPRFPYGDVSLSSPISGAGAPTLSGRRWIHRHIQQLLSLNRTGQFNSRTDVISVNNLSGDLTNSLTNQGREATVQDGRAQVMAPTFNVFFEERLTGNPPPPAPVQRGDFFSSGSNHLRRQAFENLPSSGYADSSVNGPTASPVLRQGVQHLTTFPADRPLNNSLWSELSQINSVSGFNSNRLNMGVDDRSIPHMTKEETEFRMSMDQLQSMIQIHLKDLSKNIDSGHSSFKAIERSATNTILAACGIENRGSDVYQVPPPAICSHIELMAGGQAASLVKGCCSACFNSFVGDVVKKILNTSLSQWLSLGL